MHASFPIRLEGVGRTTLVKQKNDIITVWIFTLELNIFCDSLLDHASLWMVYLTAQTLKQNCSQFKIHVQDD